MKHLPLLAASLLALPACGADDATDGTLDATFSTADDQHRVRAIGSAVGMDYMISMFIASAYAGVDAPDGCPRSVVDGSVTTVTGGCDTDDGRVEGTVVIDNVPTFFGEDTTDRTRPQTVEFDGYVAGAPDDQWAIDGSIRVDVDRAISAQLTVGTQGLFSTTDLRMTCTDIGACTAGAGSWADVDGIGRFAISGTWNLDEEAPAGRVTLTGAEVLVLDLDANANGCIPFTIDGEPAGELCNEPG